MMQKDYLKFTSISHIVSLMIYLLTPSIAFAEMIRGPAAISILTRGNIIHIYGSDTVTNFLVEMAGDLYVCNLIDAGGLRYSPDLVCRIVE